MGMDIVELIMRTEEVFGVTIDDTDAEQIQTVGDLYELVCKLLNVYPNPSPDQLTGTHQIASKYRLLDSQSPEDIWIKLVVTICDQLQVDPAEVRYDATFQNDLGAD
jgi:acyl carrier protein